MTRKNIERGIITVISIVLAIIVGILLYNWCNTFEFEEELYHAKKVYLQEIKPFSEEDYKEIVIDDKVKEELLELIINRPYYKWNMEGYRGYSSYSEDSRSGPELKIIRIGIISSNYDNDKLHYEYWISNTGQLEIRNVYKGVSGFYSLRKFPSSWFDIEGKDTKVLYNQLEELIH